MTEKIVRHEDQPLQYLGKREVLRLNGLMVDNSYQREVKPHHRRIAREFNPMACQPLVVARRLDSSLWIIDGQQRREALLLLGIEQWDCNVVPSDGPETEARLFNILGGGKRTVVKLTSYDVFRAQLIARDPVALSVKEVVEAEGFKLGLVRKQKDWPNLSSFSSMWRAVDAHGPEPLRKALQVIMKTWPHIGDATSHGILMGLCGLFAQNPQAVVDRVSTCLKPLLPSAVENQAKMMNTTGDRSAAVTRVIIERYNKRLSEKNRLKMWDGSNKKEDKEPEEKPEAKEQAS